MEEILQAGLQYLQLGFSIIPLVYKDKKPSVPSWREYQERPPTEEEVRAWFSGDKPKNIAIVCGEVSKNLFVIDFDDSEKFSEWYENLKPELQSLVRDTWVVETSKGYHVYFRTSRPEFLPGTSVRAAEGIDIKSKGSYVVAPPSVHPSGKQYKTVWGGPEQIVKLTSAELWDLLDTLGVKSSSYTINNNIDKEKEELPDLAKCRDLEDSKILKVVDSLRPYYRPGSRDIIVMYLSGWLRKANVCYESAEKLLQLLAEEDEEKSQRLYVLKRTYGLAGRPPEEVKGKTGLQEVLEQAAGEETALEIIRTIEEVLGVASPFRDSVFSLLDYEKQLYAVANLRKMIIVTARRTDNGGIKYKARIMLAAPRELYVYIDPWGGVKKYKVVMEGPALHRPLTIGPAFIEDILDRLRAEGGIIVNSRLARDVFNALITAYIQKGRAEIRAEIDRPGFYLVDGTLTAVAVDTERPGPEEIKGALELLNELATKWFGHMQDRFSTVVKWVLVAPLAFVYKQKHRPMPWLYIYGPSRTGKTTLAELARHVWGLTLEHRTTGAAIDTKARIGHVLQGDTFPVIINEPGGIFDDVNIKDIIKNAVEYMKARGRHVKGTYVEIPALRPLIFTSNRVIPRDDALVSRLVIIKTSYNDKIKQEDMLRFKEEVEPKLPALRALGKFAAWYFLQHPELLEESWDRVAEKVLKAAYVAAGSLEVPAWVGRSYKADIDVMEEIREELRAWLLEEINTAYSRHISRMAVLKDPEGSIEAIGAPDLEDRVKAVLQNKLLPYALLKDGEVILTYEFVRRLQQKIGDVGGMKSVAELLGWAYGQVWVGRNLKAIHTSLEKFVQFLEGLA